MIVRTVSQGVQGERGEALGEAGEGLGAAEGGTVSGQKRKRGIERVPHPW